MVFFGGSEPDIEGFVQHYKRLKRLQIFIKITGHAQVYPIVYDNCYPMISKTELCQVGHQNKMLGSGWVLVSGGFSLSETALLIPVNQILHI